MNIFATHEDPIASARWLWELDPARGKKMIVESCQLLSMAIARLDSKYYETNNLYKALKSQINGRFVNWLCEENENFYWLVDYTSMLLLLYRRKTNKEHGSSGYFKRIRDWAGRQGIGDIRTSFVHYAQAKSKPHYSVLPEDCADVCKAYRIYLKRQVLKNPNYWEE